MNTADIELRVKKCIAEVLGVREETVTREKTLAELGADSLDRIEIAMAMEETFGIEIPDRDTETLTTVQNAIDYVGRRLSK